MTNQSLNKTSLSSLEQEVVLESLSNGYPDYEEPIDYQEYQQGIEHEVEVIPFPTRDKKELSSLSSNVACNRSFTDVTLDCYDIRRFGKGIGLVGTVFLCLLLEYGKEPFYDGFEISVNIGDFVAKYFPEVAEDDAKFDKFCIQVNKAIAKLKDSSVESWDKTTVQLSLYFPELEVESKQKRIEQSINKLSPKRR